MTHDIRVHRAYHALRLGLGLAPLLAGADKFTNLLADWEGYLSPAARKRLPVRPRTFMRAVGVVEMAVGIGILSRFTRVASLACAGWLTAIAANLVADRKYDIAVRDVEMALGALALAALEEAGYGHRPARAPRSRPSTAELEPVVTH
jgi:hypothetical protein